MNKVFLITLLMIGLIFTIGEDNRVEASSMNKNDITVAQNMARGLYAVSERSENDFLLTETRDLFMSRFGKMQAQRQAFKSNKKIYKAVKKMDKVIRSARIAYNCKNYDEATKLVNNWVEKDYKKALDILY